MKNTLTEDAVCDLADRSLHLTTMTGSGLKAGIGQLTTFNNLGFKGVPDKPDGWYFPKNRGDVALVCEFKGSGVDLGTAQVNELLKNVAIVRKKYGKVVGLLYNGIRVRAFKNGAEAEVPRDIQSLDYYLGLFGDAPIDKEHIYDLTKRINDSLNYNFGITDLYDRMIFTACALVAIRNGTSLDMKDGAGYEMFRFAITSSLTEVTTEDVKRNERLSVMLDVFSKIEMNQPAGSSLVKGFVKEFVGWVSEISGCLDSSAWRGEDVMGIFFNEFNRYKKKSEFGQVFTPEHITDFMYRLIEVEPSDHVLDATCGSGGFLVKAMANMINESGGERSEAATQIKTNRLFGIEFDRKLYALACANMLIHKDGRTNLVQMDARTEEAGGWIADQGITKVLMNPPYENKSGCMSIVKNVLDHVQPRAMCAFILPDKKLEKAGVAFMRDLLERHSLRKVVKLPDDLFFGIGVTTSVFVFEAGTPQRGKKFFACRMVDDGLETVKNKGRHDVRGRWSDIKENWLEIVGRQAGDLSCQWNDPARCLSYVEPQEPFSISDEDFRRVALNYSMFQKGIDAKGFDRQLLHRILLTGDVKDGDASVTVTLQNEDDHGKD